MTRERIVDMALSLASSVGLEGLTIGNLATKLGLSKSGLFAHFGSKDELELEVLRSARHRFEETVIRPALSAPRGEPGESSDANSSRPIHIGDNIIASSCPPTNPTAGTRTVSSRSRSRASSCVYR
jgi:AcrR family transcriptional regulator